MTILTYKSMGCIPHCKLESFEAKVEEAKWVIIQSVSATLVCTSGEFRSAKEPTN
jgi:hypothetical protein